MDADPVLFTEVVGRLRAGGSVFAEEEAAMLVEAAEGPDALEESIRTRVTGTPIEIVVGWALFAGRRIHVSAGVFVPRRRTEALASEATRGLRRGDVVVEICCGSGAISAVVSDAVPGIVLHAADIDPVAVACAVRNLPSTADVTIGDLFDPIDPTVRGRAALVIANVPYVPSDEIAFLPAEAREHEPLHTLDGGSDGLTLLRRVAAAAPDWLRPGGRLLVESSERQAPIALAILEEAGLLGSLVVDDDRSATVLVGTRPAG